MSGARDFELMARAIALARRGLATTHPNPRVGCVLARGGEVVGEGWHQRAGAPHAEVAALAAAGQRACGATAYVSLEPCCHQGRTPPCTRALLHAGVARVVAAMRDPNPRVAGRGLAELRAAGVATECGVLESVARELNAGFVTRMERGRPRVTLKLAMSLDGRTASAGGESKWITSVEARRDVQWLRACSDAVLTGIGTVLADDPSLNVRRAELGTRATQVPGPPRQPLRVVVDGDLRMPITTRMLALPGTTLVATCNADPGRAAALRARGVEILVLPAGNGGVSMPALLAALAEREVNEVLVEAGAGLAGTLIGDGLADELVLYAAPLLLGDAARGLLTLPRVRHLGDGLRLELADVTRIGPDLRLRLRPVPR